MAHLRMKDSSGSGRPAPIVAQAATTVRLRSLWLNMGQFADWPDIC